MAEGGNQKEKKCWTCFCCCCFKTKKKKNGDVTEDPQERAELFTEDLKERNVMQPVSYNLQYTDDVPSPQQLLPYLGELSNLKIGDLVTVKGYVNNRCRRFSINFLCGKDADCDIAFHFNPRMEQRYVVRNCRIKGHWGDEETTSIASFDFAVGNRFKVDFLVAEHEFMVSVNGTHWCAFTYRVPLVRIIGLEVRGKVDVQEVAVNKIDAYPVVPEPAVLIGVNEEKGKTQNMPFVGKLTKPLTQGWLLEISGRLKMLPQSFYINLQDGVQMWPHPTIPLHLNPRFCTTAGVDVFVRNAWIDGNWGQEERAPIFPFLPGANFKIQIYRDTDSFTIWVGDKMVALFKFRGAIEEIKYVYISGDLTVDCVTLRSKRATDSTT